MGAVEETITDAEIEAKIPPWAAGNKLRKLEQDVLIPNIMRRKAKVTCREYMDAFGACCHGRTLSLAWACKKERDVMKDCLVKELAKPELFEESKFEYLSDRKEFQTHYAKTGEKKRPERKESAF